MWVCGGRAALGATFASQDCISFHLRAELAQWLLHFSFSFFLTYFDQSLLSWHPQRDILTSENSFSIFRLWLTKAGFSFLPSDRDICHLKWLVQKVCTWGLDNQVNDGKLRCVNVIVLKHAQMCWCYQTDLCLAADRNSGLWGQNLLLNWGKPEGVWEPRCSQELKTYLLLSAVCRSLSFLWGAGSKARDLHMAQKWEVW